MPPLSVCSARLVSPSEEQDGLALVVCSEMAFPPLPGGEAPSHAGTLLEPW